MKIALFLLLTISSIAYADDIFLKSGIVIRNVKVDDSTYIYLNILLNRKPTTILLSLIEKIELKKLDASQPAKYERFKPGTVTESEIKSKYEPSQLMSRTIFEYPNLKLLPVSFVCFGLGFLVNGKRY